MKMMDAQWFVAICILLSIAAASADDAAKRDSTTLGAAQAHAIEPAIYHFSGGRVGAPCYLWQSTPRTAWKYNRYCKDGLVCCPKKPWVFPKDAASSAGTKSAGPKNWHGYWYSTGVCAQRCDTDAPQPQLGKLQVTPTQVVAGYSDQLIFTATFTSAPGKAIKLHESNATGAIGPFLADLYDDGSFSHRDTKAGDNTFSNVISIEGDVPGTTKHYIAVVEGATRSAVANVTIMVRISEAQVQEQIQQVNQLQTQLDALVAGGSPRGDALAQVAVAIKALPAVDVGSVLVTARQVTWMTKDGMSFIVSSYAPGERSGRGLELAAMSNYGPARQLHRAPLQTQPGTECSPKGQVAVLAPYFAAAEPGPIAAQFRNAGYDVIFHCDNDQDWPGQGCQVPTATGPVTIEEMKGWGKYVAVVWASHGDSDDNGFNQVVHTVIQYSGEYYGDWIAKRFVVGAQHRLSFKAAWFAKYSGKMDNTVVYIGNCRSSRSREFADTFLGLGASVYAGFSNYVRSPFAARHGEDMFTHLVPGGGNIGSIPGVGDRDTAGLSATFDVFSNGQPATTLAVYCDSISDYLVYIKFDWPDTQEDLDINVGFIGSHVGFYCGSGSDYLSWPTNDNTNEGGTGGEVVLVDVGKAYKDGKIPAKLATITLAAGWYRAKGKGPATITVGLLNKTHTWKQHEFVIRPTQDTIDPAAYQRGCAQQSVGQLEVAIAGKPGQETLSIDLAAGPECSKEQTLTLVDPKGAESCSDACGALQATSTGCMWRTVNGGTGASDMCLAAATVGDEVKAVAGTALANTTASCHITPSAGVVQVMPAADQLCVCTSCKGGDCANLFWKPASTTPCPHSDSDTDVSEILPTGYPHGLYWGKFCRLTAPPDEYGTTGYLNPLCNAGTGAKTSFEKWCPPELQINRKAKRFAHVNTGPKKP